MLVLAVERMDARAGGWEVGACVVYRRLSVFDFQKPAALWLTVHARVPAVAEAGASEEGYMRIG